MSQPDIILIIALAVIAGGVGYLLGTKSPKRGTSTQSRSNAPPSLGSGPPSTPLKDPVVTPVVASAVVSRPPPEATAKEKPSHNDIVEATATPKPPDESQKTAKVRDLEPAPKPDETKTLVSKTNDDIPVPESKKVVAVESAKPPPKEEPKPAPPPASAFISPAPVPVAPKSDPAAAAAALVAAVRAKSSKPPAPPATKSNPSVAAAKPQGVAALAAMITKPGAPAKPAASPPTPAAAPSKPKTEPLPKLEAKEVDGKGRKPAASRPDIPKIEFEEDEDVEPTKVGEVQTSVLQPPILKSVFDEGADSEEPMSEVPLFVISATAQTDPGLRRKRNEDNLLVLESSNLFVVADGMGGHRGGQLASELAVKRIGDAFRARKFEGEQHEGIGREGSELARAMQMANAAIFSEAKRNRELEGMGTTVCAARFSPNKRRMCIGHVGDSRCYRLRSGVLSIMTHDHTMADHGVTGPESANLSRAIGIWPTVPMDVILAVPQVGDVYVLCSDGLTKMLPDEQIATVLRGEEDPKAAVERLVFFANARGGKDNITVILLRVVAHKRGERRG